MRFAREAKVGLLLACLPIFGVGCASLSPKLNVLPSLAKHRSQSQYQAARQAEQRGQYTKARDMYALLQKNSPNTPEYAHRMGVVCTQLQDYVTAGKYYEHARGLDARNPALLADMGYSAYLQGDYASAESLLKQSVALGSTDPRALNNLAMAVGFQGRYDESLELFRKANPESQALVNLAFVQSQRNEPDAAMATYQRVLANEPGNLVATRAIQQLAANRTDRPVAVAAVAKPAAPVEAASDAPQQISILPAGDASSSPDVVESPVIRDADLPRRPPVIASYVELPPPSHGETAIVTPGDPERGATRDDVEAPSSTLTAAAAAQTPAATEPEFELPSRSNPPGELEADPAESPILPSPVAEPDSSAPTLPNSVDAAAKPSSASSKDDLTNVFEGSDDAPETVPADMEELTGLDWAQAELARAKAAAETSENAAPRSNDCLRGFCPVTLRDERRLMAAVDEFSAEYQAQTFRFCSADARSKFLAHPEWYAPAAGGLDVIEVKQGHETAQGSLDHACWFRHRLHLFASAENLAAFRATPREFVSRP
jgi:tetratricopeptide (TPR) repeat protein